MADQSENRAISFAAYLTSKVDQLEAGKRKLFLEWLRAHSGEMVNGSDRKNLRDSLTSWFSSLSPPELIREYKLVLSEILWWYELEKTRLDEIKADQAIN